MQIINRSVDESTNNGSFLEKLIAIAQENPDYTINDVMLDAHTLVLAVNILWIRIQLRRH